MKNWKYINGAEVGNADVSSTHLKDIEEQIKNWEHAIDKVEGIDKEKAKKILEDLRKERAELRSQTGNETMHEWATSKPRNIGNTKVINSDREFFKELADDAKEREDKDKQEVEKLVENSTVSEYNAEIQRLTRKAEQLRRMGQGKSAMEVEKQIEKLGNELAEVGNSKVGNATVLKDGKYVIEQLEKSSSDNFAATYFGMKKGNYCLKNTKTGVVLGWYTTLDAAKKSMKEWQDDDKVWGNSKAGNSASDDKFAYVMREFDEGKLKTPDGKVVTDPAQAKAIAYSESKKTENGLARARNAMVKNIATYKDFIKDLKNAIMLDVAGINYDSVDEQTLKSWVEQAKKDGYASAIKGLQGKKVILDVY